MKAKEYIEKLGIDEKSTLQLCFVIGEVHGEGIKKQIFYRTSPLRCIWEWFDSLKKSNGYPNVLNYNVLNTKQPVISWLSGSDWNPAIENNRIMSLLVMSDEELDKAHSRGQWMDVVNFIDKKINKDIECGTNWKYNNK